MTDYCGDLKKLDHVLRTEHGVSMSADRVTIRHPGTEEVYQTLVLTLDANAGRIASVIIDELLLEAAPHPQWEFMYRECEPYLHGLLLTQ